MKIIVQDNNNYVLRFDKGEEVVAGLAKFMQENSVFACSFSGIGAAGEVELGYFNSHIKDYRKKPFVEDLEIISFIGNGGLKDGAPIIHAHGMFGRTDFTVIGGHVFKLTVSITAEIHLIKLSGALERVINTDFNLNSLA